MSQQTATSPAPAGATYEANNQVSFKTNASVTGALTPTAPNDSGTLGDNLTNDNTPALSGTVPVGSTATVTINGNLVTLPHMRQQADLVKIVQLLANPERGDRAAVQVHGLVLWAVRRPKRNDPAGGKALSCGHRRRR